MPVMQSLSEREIEILNLVASGKSNKEIARHLQISTNTVKVHVQNIFRKLEVNSRTEASMVAIREELIDSRVLDGEFSDEKGEDQEEETGEDSPGAEPTPEAPIPETLPSENTSREQNRWAVIGFLVVVVLLVAIVFRLYNPTASPEAINLPENAEQVTIENRWVAQPNLPGPRSRAAGIAFENNLYLIGGSDGTSPLPDLIRYSPELGAWSQLSPKPTSVSEIQAAVIDQKIYVPGGRTASGAFSNALEIYDPLTDEWQTGPDLPEGISAYALVAHNGGLYLFGGVTEEGYSNRVYRFDSGTNLWEEENALPVSLGYSGAVAIASKIYVVGGFDGEEISRRTFQFTPNAESAAPWQAVSDLPEGRYGMGVVALDNQIHVVGGIGESDSTFTHMSFDPIIDAWSIKLRTIEDEWAFLSTIVIGSDIYSAGGEVNSQVTNQFSSYSRNFIIVLPITR